MSFCRCFSYFIRYKSIVPVLWWGPSELCGWTMIWFPVIHPLLVLPDLTAICRSLLVSIPTFVAVRCRCIDVFVHWTAETESLSLNDGGRSLLFRRSSFIYDDAIHGRSSHPHSPPAHPPRIMNILCTSSSRVCDMRNNHFPLRNILRWPVAVSFAKRCDFCLWLKAAFFCCAVMQLLLSVLFLLFAS